MRRAVDTPGEVAAGLERGQPLPSGPGERYLGYGILGVAFASGDLLALRRFPVASSGCGYTALWHRSPDGAWTFYTDATCDQGCTSHFAPALDRLAVAPIRLEWTDPWTLSIGVNGGRGIAWTVSVASSWQTRLLTALAAAAPAALWASPRGLALVAAIARGLLGTGRLKLAGRLPSGARYLSNPQRVWAIDASRAAIRGVDLGAMTRLRHPVALGDFAIPRCALLASGPLGITPPDAGRPDRAADPEADPGSSAASRMKLPIASAKAVKPAAILAATNTSWIRVGGNAGRHASRSGQNQARAITTSAPTARARHDSAGASQRRTAPTGTPRVSAPNSPSAASGPTTQATSVASQRAAVKTASGLAHPVRAMIAAVIDPRDASTHAPAASATHHTAPNTASAGSSRTAGRTSSCRRMAIGPRVQRRTATSSATPAPSSRTTISTSDSASIKAFDSGVESSAQYSPASTCSAKASHSVTRTIGELIGGHRRRRRSG